ncbi:sialate O-acetylesterase [Pedobacter sp. SAFR-022]|uniref:sialate O-acetylesterase n=1 Tax=Pedobacter sp. SAFR-022 TaxID=3436861 RepID=UPI003F7DC6FD
MHSFFYFIRKLLLWIALLGAGNLALAQLRLPKVFSDHMILQRTKPIPVWGSAKAGERITIEFGGQRYHTITGRDGKWRVQMAAMNAGGPYVMSVFGEESTQEALTFKDILIGDVWIASGQSNMEWQVSQSQNAGQEIKNANYPAIRFFNVPHAKQVVPQDTLAGGSWVSMDTAGVKTASAVAYFFARSLHGDLKVPIGIVQSTWGGTPVEAWTSRPKLLESPITKSRVMTNDSITAAHFVKDSLDLLKFWDIVYKADTSIVSSVTGMAYNDSRWRTIEMPATLKDMNMPGYEGIVWLRRELAVGADIPGAVDLSIELGHPEMNYSVYINGREIAKTEWNANLSHKYNIPSGLLKKGRNVVAVRMAFLWGGGGFNPASDGMYVSAGNTRFSLAGTWKFMTDMEASLPTIKNYHRYPSYLYNAMINPIVSYGAKGFLWYQGEDNASAPDEYRSLFPMMIRDWRERWGQGYLPFLYVQLANYMKRQEMPAESDWAKLREAQTMTLSEPNTGMAVIIDVGAADDIHPKNKQEVGRRLALLAKKQVYQQNIQAQSPVYKNHQIEGQRLRVTFEETGKGLKTSDGKEVKGFAIAGSDGKFHWAEASIQGNNVIVSAPGVANPVAVRYAWADNPACNLVNSAGLPAVPFRTDPPKNK